MGQSFHSSATSVVYPPTWRRLLAHSTLEDLDPEEDDFDHRDYRYEDFMPGLQGFGYNTRLLPPKHIRWLDAVRLVTNKSVDTVKGTETEASVPLLTPLVGRPGNMTILCSHILTQVLLRQHMSILTSARSTTPRTAMFYDATLTDT
jgi:hypothetical protein